MGENNGLTAFQIANIWYWLLTFRFLTQIRGALVSIIYRGMLSIRAESDASAGVGLMSNDVDRITVTIVWVVSFVPCLVHVAIALWILGTQLGGSCIAPVIMALRMFDEASEKLL